MVITSVGIEDAELPQFGQSAMHQESGILAAANPDSSCLRIASGGEIMTRVDLRLSFDNARFGHA